MSERENKMYTIRGKYGTLVGALRLTKYADGNNALQILAADYPETLSINLGTYYQSTPEGHVFVKDYGEHEGLPDALVAAGVVEKVGPVQFGHGTGWLCKVIAETV